MSNSIQAWNEGLNARLTDDDCPYAVDSRLAMHWQRGYDLLPYRPLHTHRNITKKAA